jgi:hypothetical protein
LSDKFNEPLNAALEAVVGKKWAVIPEEQRHLVSDDHMGQMLKEAHEEVQEKLGLNKTEQPKRTSPSVSKPTGSKPKGDPVAQLTESSKKTYNVILDKYGKDAADDFAKGMTGGEK